MIHRFSTDPLTSRILKGWIIGIMAGLLAGCNTSTALPTPTGQQVTAQAVPTQDIAPQISSLQPSAEDATNTLMSSTQTPVPTRTVDQQTATQTPSPTSLPTLFIGELGMPMLVLQAIGANAHAAPDAASEVVREVEPMEVVNVIATQGYWSQVRFEDGSTGYISSLILATPPSFPSLEPHIPLAPTLAYCTPRVDWIPYTVWPGETAGSIARRAQITVQDLSAANCLTNINVIIAGQRLYVPIALLPPPLTPTPTARGPVEIGLTMVPVATLVIAPRRRP
jgi:hypothetical protein